MTFDYENAIQQGLNRDPQTNDWNVESRNFEIVLEDAQGGGELRLLDSDNVGVVVADSDGYLAIAGNAEVHGGHILIQGEGLTNTEFITLKDHADEISIHLFDLNPDGAIIGSKGSFGTSYEDGYVYVSQGGTEWQRLALYSQLQDTSNITLQKAYDNDPDSGDAVIPTNATDGALKIAGDQKLWVTATGGLDLDTGFDMDGAGPFDVDITGAVSIDADAASNFSTSVGTITIDAAGGLVLEGNGNNVRPGTDNQDTLGTSSFGWADFYLQNVSSTATVALRDAGGNNAPNTTSGAHAVGTNALNFDTFGSDMTDNSVQAALEAIDGYFDTLTLDELDTTYEVIRGLDINGAVLNGVVKVSTDNGTPALDFHNNQTSRASWTIPVPVDWDGISDIDIEIIWSPDSTDTGDVEWRLEYKSLSLTELSSAAVSTDDYTQTAGGVTNGIQSTEDFLTIPSSAIGIGDDLIVINIVRRGKEAGDTFVKYAQVHLVKYKYTAQNIV